MWNINTLTICFFVYCILGWCCEEVYCYLLSKKWVNRGFLYGPYLPIYGSGAMAVVLMLERFLSYPVLVFILGLIVCSLIEYVAHWGLERIFQIKLWDYSTYRFNINGRVCLRNSLLFGVCSILVMYVINVPLLKLVFSLNDYVAYTLSSLIFFLMLVDSILSVMKLKAFKRAMLEFEEATKEFNAKADERFERSVEELGAIMKSKLDEASQERERVLAELRERRLRQLARMRYILRDNPSLTNRYIEHSEAIRKAREAIRNSHNEIRECAMRLKAERREKRKNGQTC